MHHMLRSAVTVIDDILYQLKAVKIDYLIHSMAFPLTKVIASVLNVPTVSSLAVFAGLRQFQEKSDKPLTSMAPGAEEIIKTFNEVSQAIRKKYNVQLPDTIMKLLFNKGDINFVYTSRLFATDLDFFDDTYKFVGPPIYDRAEQTDFPFGQLQNKKVIYISLGTVFSGHTIELYNTFFKSFNLPDTVVVMAAYNVDLTQFSIPDNFIVRNYVPQSAILKYAHVAVTHAGMNSISDLVYHNIPFVSIPLGADQPLLAKRAEELGATIVLDAKILTPPLLEEAVDKVFTDPPYLKNIRCISESFKNAGGYPAAVAEIFKLKQEKGIK